MSLAEKITEETPVSEEEIKFGQRRLAFLNQLAEILEEVNMTKEDIMKEFGIDDEQEYREKMFNPTLQDISKLETFLGENFLVFMRNVKFLDEDE